MRISVSMLLVFVVIPAATAAFGDGPSSATSPSARAETAVAAIPPEEEPPVPIVLYPAVEPRPSLKYQLLPPLVERRPGNAAVWWNRIGAEWQREVLTFGDPEITIGAWERMPLGTPAEIEFRKTKVGPYRGLLSSSPVFSDMDRAARFDSCDWEFPHQGRTCLAIPPEIRQTVHYARLLAAKARWEIAQGKYDQAVATFQTGYALARHVGQGPTYIHFGFGGTCAEIISDQVRELIQRPDAPNLYWALTTLPQPLIDFCPALAPERNILYLFIPELQGVDQKRLSPQEWEQLLMGVAKEVPSFTHGGLDDSALARKSVSARVAQLEPFAKRFLTEHGVVAAQVEAMSAAQAVLLASLRIYDEASQDWYKWYSLPYPEAAARWVREQSKWKRSLQDFKGQQVERDLKGTGEDQLFLLLDIFALSPRAAKSFETRSRRDFAILRVFEAMRLYAGAHDGRWPDRLAEITDVPVPNDPFTEKPFVYQWHGDKVIVDGERQAVWIPRTGQYESIRSVRYEVTLKGKPK